ncbi:S53 family peptidase [Patescibacteria group bacterium]|nr:S53 family peptidase [Patescibacteria group bacterium]
MKHLTFFLLGFFVFVLGFCLVKLTPSVQAQSHGKRHAAVCGSSARDSARCHARVIVDDKGNPQTSRSPSGYGPTQFTKAYNLSGTVSAAQTIAIVDAYDHPNILSDLNTYSRQYGLPPMASCPVSGGTAANPCFQKVNQNGGTNYPSANSSWALEISLDVEAAHAVCHNCNLLLVEANSASYTDLMTAVDRARLMGATVISNSYGSSEFSGETTFDTHFNHPGIAFIFSSGDNGYGPQYPAASPYVTATGGTTLLVNSDNTYNSETAWSGAGSGCSVYEPKPSWQKDTQCSLRTIADVSADADPGTGAAVYDSIRYQGRKGWFQVGGTSLSAPLIAATYALAGNAASATNANALPYQNPSALHDVVSGSNGTCNGSYLCTATTGYDGPTGLGSPNGTPAF